MTNLVGTIAGKAQSLPLEIQREVLSFIEFKLHQSHQPNGQDKTVSERPVTHRPSNLGSLAHLGITVTDEDIAEVRREMWANFPREEPN